MERQIEKYFQEELNADERLDFLKQIESDNELKKQFIKFKNTYALLSFSDAACGKKTTRDSYTQFLCKMRAKHIRQKQLKSLSRRKEAASRVRRIKLLPRQKDNLLQQQKKPITLLLKKFRQPILRKKKR